jgi:hypothetical protein
VAVQAVKKRKKAMEEAPIEEAVKQKGNQRRDLADDGDLQVRGWGRDALASSHNLEDGR